MTIQQWLGVPHRSAGTRHRIPFGERPCPKQAVVHRPQQMSADPEEILHEAVYREKPLRVRGGFEPAHLAFALACRLMRDLREMISAGKRYPR